MEIDQLEPKPAGVQKIQKQVHQPAQKSRKRQREESGPNVETREQKRAKLQRQAVVEAKLAERPAQRTRSKTSKKEIASRSQSQSKSGKQAPNNPDSDSDESSSSEDEGDVHKLRADKFEKKISKMPANERVAAVNEEAEKIARVNGWEKRSDISKRNNGRKVYLDKKNKNLYSVDTQHGRLEKTNINGKHLGEFDFGLKQTKPADLSGRHNLIVK